MERVHAEKRRTLALVAVVVAVVAWAIGPIFLKRADFCTRV